MKIPEPSKRPFGSPLTEEALPYFCHPTLAPFRHPVRHPEDGLVYAASGFIACRFRTGRWFAEEFPAAPPEWVERVAALPWVGFLPDPRCLVEPVWRMMDDSRGTIYRDGPLPLWLPDGRLNRNPLVHTAGGPIVPLALLQLIARLPRAEVRMTAGSQNPLFIRFNGGEAIVPPMFRCGVQPPHKFSLFPPKGMMADIRGEKF